MVTNSAKIEEYYSALIKKDTQYEGIFFAGITTTGIFCRPTCHARKPHKEHCNFYETAQEALLSGFRPCKVCKPMQAYQTVSPEVQKLVQAVEAHPQKKWKDSDFDTLSISSATARRQFKKYFGMTFIEYARARRLGIAFGEIRAGKPLIEAQQESGFDSANGFRDAFTQIMGTLPKHAQHTAILYSAWLETPLGPMLAITNATHLFLLEFIDRRGLETEIMRLRSRLSAAIIPQRMPVINQLEQELQHYFVTGNAKFHTPLQMVGSPFQKKVWEELQKIPAGSTIPYQELATRIGNKQASRAVALANGANQIAILIPCHRVINKNGELGGYGGGIARKQWLLEREITQSE